MALMLGVGDESAGYVGHKEVKRKWEDTSSPHGITPGTINNIERGFQCEFLFDSYRNDSHTYDGFFVP